MDQVKIKWFEKQPGGYSENYSSGLQYALASDKNEQACGFVWCKDFLQDAYLAYFNKNSRSTYGFRYEYGKDIPLSVKSMKILLVNNADKTFSAKMKKATEFVNQIETELKMRKKTTIRECVDPPKKFKNGVFLVEGNKRWYMSPPMISLYTLLIRVGAKHLKKHGTWRETVQLMIDGKITPYQSYDQSQITTAIKGIEHIIKHNDRKIFGKDVMLNYPDSISTNSMHHESGIVAFSQGYNSGVFPGWYAIPFEAQKKTIKGTPCDI